MAKKCPRTHAKNHKKKLSKIESILILILCSGSDNNNNNNKNDIDLRDFVDSDHSLASHLSLSSPCYVCMAWTNDSLWEMKSWRISLG